jgi:CheY-like chemotaxis protein/prolyl-tRNA editing enzyme YbaK/EbsC (Cys-tRNA(Pro) deacylase)
MSIPRWCEHILDYHGVAYKELHHPPVFSASRLARAEHVSGRRVAKTVLLNARNHPVAVILPACARLDLGRVQAVLGAEGLSLATEGEIAGWFKGCHPGCVPPLRLRTDELLLMDRSLAHLKEMVFAAGTPEDAVAVRFRDWLRAVRPGVGSFALPADEAATPEPPLVLIVEDEADTNQLLCRLLEREGVVCHGVEGGSEALAAAQKVRPAAILLDLMLPDMSGFEMYERLQRNGPNQHIPCIIMTALDDEASRRRGEQLGVDVYMTKPFRPRALVTELQDILSATRP